MENPFLKEGCVVLEASLNKLMLLETANIDSSGEIEGKSAFEIFSTGKIIEEIKKSSKSYGFDIEGMPDWKLPVMLNEFLDSSNIKIKNGAEEITEKFGRRLGAVFYILRRGKSSCEKERKDWDDRHWDYWKQIDNVCLSGGLSTGKLGKRFKEYIEKVMAESGEKPYNIILSGLSENAGLAGAAAFFDGEDCAGMVFDFGQTFLKRGITEYNGKIVPFTKLESKYMDWNENKINDNYCDAKKLNDYLVQCIENTYNEAVERGLTISDSITISIANYIKEGRLLNRGGYGKLLALAENYEEYFTQCIRKKTGRKFCIKMIHDGTAIAQNFHKIERCVSVSVGTAFGVGFPIDKSYFNSQIKDKPKG